MKTGGPVQLTNSWQLCASITSFINGKYITYRNAATAIGPSLGHSLQISTNHNKHKTWQILNV